MSLRIACPIGRIVPTSLEIDNLNVLNGGGECKNPLKIEFDPRVKPYTI